MEILPLLLVLLVGGLWYYHARLRARKGRDFAAEAAYCEGSAVCIVVGLVLYLVITGVNLYLGDLALASRGDKAMMLVVAPLVLAGLAAYFYRHSTKLHSQANAARKAEDDTQRRADGG